MGAGGHFSGGVATSPDAHSGSNVFTLDSKLITDLNHQDAFGTLAQTVATTTGQHYTLDFFLATDQVTAPASVDVWWDLDEITSVSDQSTTSVPGYTEYTFDVVGGPGSSSKLEFMFENLDSAIVVKGPDTVATWYLDDVSLTTGVSLTTSVESTGGAISFTDGDFTDTHTVSVEKNSNIGTFTATLANDSTDGGTGTVDWAFTVSDAALAFLAAGQTESETFTVDIQDSVGAFTSQDVDITLTGTNDDPVFTGGTTTGVVNEQPFVTNADPTTVTDGTTGTLDFTDPDLIDAHAASTSYVANSAVWLAGDSSPIPAQTLSDLASAMQAEVTAESTNGATGQVTWSVNIPDRDLDFLQQGQVLNASYDVTVADGHGGTATQAVDVTFVGTEDAPQVTSGAQTGAVARRTARVSLISNGGFEDNAPLSASWTLADIFQGGVSDLAPAAHSGSNVFTVDAVELIPDVRVPGRFRAGNARADHRDDDRPGLHARLLPRDRSGPRRPCSDRSMYCGMAMVSRRCRTKPRVRSRTTPNIPLTSSVAPDRARNSNSISTITRTAPLL